MIITWNDVVNRYPEFNTLPSAQGVDVRNELVAYAEAEVHSRLAARYTTPFSSNNYTARTLAVDTMYVQLQTTRQPEKAKALRELLDARYTALLDGTSSMIDSLGAVITMVGDTVWSSTQDYPPVFGVGPIEYAIVSSEQVYDEANTRGEV